MVRAPRLLAVVGGALAAAVVAASIVLVVVHPSLAPLDREPGEERLSSELLIMVAASCVAGHGGVGAMHLGVDPATGVVSVTVIDERGRADGEVPVELASCVSQYRIEAGAGFGWQPTPAQALAMHDRANRWVVPCLIAHDLPPVPRTAADVASGNWSPYADRYTPERLDDILAAYRRCGSTAAPFLAAEGAG